MERICFFFWVWVAFIFGGEGGNVREELTSGCVVSLLSEKLVLWVRSSWVVWRERGEGIFCFEGMETGVQMGIPEWGGYRKVRKWCHLV